MKIKCKDNTVVINNVEYDIVQHDNGKKLSEIKIPKGWRLLYPSEAMMLFERGIIKKGWIYVQNVSNKYKSKDYVSRFYFDKKEAWFDLTFVGKDGTYDPNLGVIFAKDEVQK